MAVNREPMDSGLDDDAHRAMAVAALSPEMQVVMATHALRGLRFLYFGNNGEHRRWKALDFSRPIGQAEVMTASTLYVLLSALGKPA